MDNLALTRVARELATGLPGASLVEFRQEAAERFRLVFVLGPSSSVLAVSLRPEMPWIGGPPGGRERTAWSPDPFAALAARELTGRVVASVSKPPADRSLVIEFAGGRGLAVELATHAGNLVVLGEAGVVIGAAHRPRSSAERLAPGAPYAPRGIPQERLDPFRSDAAAIDARLDAAAARGESPFEGLRREIAGLGSAAAALVVDEARGAGLSAGAVLRARLDDVLAGRDGLAIEGPAPPEEAVDRGEFSAAGFRLLPWRPAAPAPGMRLFASRDSIATAGLYYACLETAARLEGRVAALRGLLHAEARRVASARAKAREEGLAFADPERFRREGEALLAGLSLARREGATVRVPDPYDADGASLEIEAAAGLPLTRVADDLFRRHRRARRGLAAAAARAEALSGRLAALEALAGRPVRATEAEVALLEAGMRKLGLAVGLARPTRAARAAARLRKPLLDGVRIVESADGVTILVGKTGRDNDRLTFKIAGPDDIWLHAEGVSGAHVVIRREGGSGEVPRATLLEAARLAAWFSDARSEAAVEVRWTPRKYVRRAKGAASGTVLLKRFRTLRVRPEPPAEGRR